MKKKKCKIVIKAKEMKDGYIDVVSDVRGNVGYQLNVLTDILCRITLEEDIELSELKRNLTHMYNKNKNERKEG